MKLCRESCGFLCESSTKSSVGASGSRFTFRTGVASCRRTAYNVVVGDAFLNFLDRRVQAAKPVAYRDPKCSHAVLVASRA